MKIAVNNLQTKVPIPYSKIRTVALAACKKLRLASEQFDLSIVFVGQERMRRLNKSFLGHDYVTDVITFDLQESAAEIVICPQVALKNSKIYQQSLTQELLLYTVHGILHLAGYKDHTRQDIKQMRAQEQKLLSQLL